MAEFSVEKNHPRQMCVKTLGAGESFKEGVTSEGLYKGEAPGLVTALLWSMNERGIKEEP